MTGAASTSRLQGCPVAKRTLDPGPWQQRLMQRFAAALSRCVMARSATAATVVPDTQPSQHSRHLALRQASTPTCCYLRYLLHCRDPAARPCWRYGHPGVLLTPAFEIVLVQARASPSATHFNVKVGSQACVWWCVFSLLLFFLLFFSFFFFFFSPLYSSYLPQRPHPIFS